jgi:hypothetical protein
MNFDAYEKKHEALYAEFAETIKPILEKAIAVTDGIPRPQSVQCRAKSAASLKRVWRMRIESWMRNTP